MSLTITSARFANPDGTAIELQTAESGAVIAVNRPNRKEAWDAMQAWIAAGNTPAAFVAPTVQRGRDAAAELDALKARLIAKGVLTAQDL